MPAKTLVAKAPCGKCPFRSDVPIYLRRGRRIEIATALLNGSQFSCHSTVDYSREDDEGDTLPDDTDASFCAGATKALMQIGAPNQQLRIMERLGEVDLDKVADTGADCWDLTTWQTLPEGATAEDPGVEDEDDEVQTCNTVGPNCLAPAGYAIGGGVTYGTESADGECYECGDPCCSECLEEVSEDDNLRCGSCASWYREDED